MNKILVSIVVPNYNGKKFLGSFLDSIRKLDFPKNKIETIVVDNNSRDNSVEFIRKKYPEVKIIENDKNLGYAGGSNLGVRIAKGKYVAIGSVDLVFDRNWAKELFNVIERDKRIASVGAKIFDKNEKGKYDFSSYDAPTLMQFHTPIKNINKATTKSFEVFGFSSPFYKKDIVDFPFDSDYFAYAEDTYFCWLMRLMGYELQIVPKAIVYHEGSGTIKEMKRDHFFTFLGERNRLMNFFLFFELSTIIKLLLLFFFTLVVYNLFDFKNILPRLRSYLWLIINFNNVLKKRRKIQAKRKVNDTRIIRHMSSKMFDESLSENKILKKAIILLNELSLLNCKLFNLKTMEFYDK